jgi:hypothetical protein
LFGRVVVIVVVVHRLAAAAGFLLSRFFSLFYSPPASSVPDISLSLSFQKRGIVSTRAKKDLLKEPPAPSPRERERERERKEAKNERREFLFSLSRVVRVSRATNESASE